MTSVQDPARVAPLLDALDLYGPARRAFLTALASPTSNRDPFAEFAERLVHALMGGDLPDSRVQVGYDLVLEDGRKVQVRYLANPGGAWVNEHLVYRIPGVDLYALVLLEDFIVEGVLAFPLDKIRAVCEALGKRHSRQDETLQFTRANFRAIEANSERFEDLGMRVWLRPLLP